MKAVFNSVLSFFLLTVIGISSCKKPVPTVDHSTIAERLSPARYSVDSVKLYLRNRLPLPIYRSIDSTGFDTVILQGLLYVRVPFSGIPLEQKFILLALDEKGSIVSANRIEVDLDGSKINGRFRSWNLDGTPATDAVISNGYFRISSSQIAINNDISRINEISPTNAAPIDPVWLTLPGVVIYPESGGNVSYYFYPAMTPNVPGNGGNSGASTVGGGGHSGGYASYVRATGLTLPASRATTGRPKVVTVETSYSKPGIKVNNYFHCFDQVPTTGAKYSIQVMVDLPVNDEPTVSFNYLTGAVGHVFMAYTKTNGAISITQFIGFAATKPFKAMFLTTPVAGKLVDNEGHKYNARYTIPVSAVGFESALNATAQQDGSYYDLANFNCVDFTLGIVNSVAPNSLSVQPLPLPGSPILMSTPGSLYIKLSSMKAAGNQNVENNGIWTAGDSHGDCN